LATAPRPFFAALLAPLDCCAVLCDPPLPWLRVLPPLALRRPDELALRPELLLRLAPLREEPLLRLAPLREDPLLRLAPLPPELLLRLALLREEPLPRLALLWEPLLDSFAF
jgi:hypothetical protein